MGESSAIANSVWSQRVDPWMILLPAIVVGLGATSLFLYVVLTAVVLPVYIAGSSNLVDQTVVAVLGESGSRIAAAAIAVAGIATGYIARQSLDKKEYSSDRKVRVISRAFAWVGFTWLISSYLFCALTGYPYAFSASFSRFAADCALGFLGGAVLVVGIGYALDYREFSAAARAAGSHIGAYVMRTGESPGLVEKATAPFGGSFYMLLDPRVKRVELRMVAGMPTRELRKQVSPDEIRRDQHLTW